MSQGFALKGITPIEFADVADVDSFGRARISAPSFSFDSQLTYNIPSLVYESVVLNGGAAVAHDATNRCALMTFAATTTGGKAYVQSYEHVRYQPGRSQLIFLTFNFIETKADCLKFVGYSDGTNGIELQQSGSTVQLAILSATTNGNQTAAQANWNIDKMNGTGPSGLTLDLTKSQILVIDLQALYVGRVRIGFDIGGGVKPVHEFNHSNVVVNPYIQSANLPIRCGMTCTGTVSTTMNFICCSVISEGGQEDIGGNAFTAEGTVTAASGARTHILSVRPKTTFNSITNRIKFVLESIDVVVTGLNPVLWELCIGQALTTPTYGDVNATYSGFEFVSAGTLSGNPALVAAGGYVAASATQRSATSTKFSNRYPITLTAAAAVRDLGTLTLLVTGIGGVSASRGRFNWKEIR